MSDPDPRISYLAVALLIYLAAWFAVTETALASVSRTKLKTASDRGDYRADDALFALDNFDRAITTILICTNIVHISAATIVTVTVTRTHGLNWVTLSTFVTTILVFFFGEMLPKSIAKKTPEKYILSHARMLIFCMKIFKPFSSILSAIGNFASKLTKSEPEVSVTEEELHDIIDDMEEQGTLEEDESDLIQSAIEFGDQTLTGIYTPRDSIFALDIHDDIDDILAAVKETSHSRIPVYDGDLDNIVGILQSRKFMIEYIKKGKDLDLRSILSRPLILRKDYNIDDILQLMAEHKYTLALVKDRENRLKGLVSMEDILEELVGEIWDEDEPQGGEEQ